MISTFPFHPDMRNKSVLVLVLGALLAFISVALPICAAFYWWSHLRAQDGSGTGHRLRYYFVAAREMEPGHQVVKQDLEFAVSRRQVGEELVQIPDDIIGSFVSNQIKRKDVLLLSGFVSTPTIEIPPGGAVVPVEVSASHISGLHPGLRVAFVKDSEMDPEAKDLSKKSAGPTFLILSIAVSGQDKNVASVLVAVEKCRMPLVKKIATGSWRPVIVKN